MNNAAIALSIITLALQIYAFLLLSETRPLYAFRQWLLRRRDQKRLRQGWTVEIAVSDPSENGNVAVGFRWVPPGGVKAEGE